MITYILLCGSRPFYARTESGIFRSVLRADPNFEDSPWPSISAEAKDFVRRLLNKDYRKRMTASQALSESLLAGLLVLDTSKMSDAVTFFNHKARILIISMKKILISNKIVDLCFSFYMIVNLSQYFSLWKVMIGI